MCRKGRMFAPVKTWYGFAAWVLSRTHGIVRRKWHRRINQNQKRYAVASALAASALPALVMARGHRVDNVPEVCRHHLALFSSRAFRCLWLSPHPSNKLPRRRRPLTSSSLLEDMTTSSRPETARSSVPARAKCATVATCNVVVWTKPNVSRSSEKTCRPTCRLQP